MESWTKIVVSYGYGEVQTLREATGQLRHLRRDLLADLERIGLRRLIDADTGGRLAVQPEVLRVGLRAEFDATDVPDADQAATLRGLILDDDVAELLRIVQP